MNGLKNEEYGAYVTGVEFALSLESFELFVKDEKAFLGNQEYLRQGLRRTYHVHCGLLEERFDRDLVYHVSEGLAPEDS